MRRVGLSLFLLFIALSVSATPNLIAQRVLNDGEIEKRIFRDGIFALETSVPGPHSTSQLRLWQVSNKRQLIQTILNSKGQIIDCEFSNDVDEIEKFLGTFDGVMTRARVLAEDGTALELERGMNETIRLTSEIDEEDIVIEDDDDVRHLLDIKRLRDECKKKHLLVKTAVAAYKDKRKKRDILIYPGTNWCGVGATTDRYNDLGFNAAADRCCRQHDFCPHTIEGLSSKYNIFNYRLHTISHCDCDERFRTCLKMVNNAASNMVGKLFFNVVQMRCFVLKAEKSCARRSWWGKCAKYEMQKAAYLHDALTF